MYSFLAWNTEIEVINMIQQSKTFALNNEKTVINYFGNWIIRRCYNVTMRIFAE